jgi:hypothetical protein
MLRGLQASQEATGRFLGVLVGAVPVASYFRRHKGESNV